MDDDVAAVGQYPVAGFLAFHGYERLAGLFQPVGELVCEGGNVAGGAAGGDDHIVGDAAFSRKVNGDDVFGFVIIQ